MPTNIFLRGIANVEKAFKSLEEEFILWTREKQPLSGIRFVLREKITRENWLTVVYESVIKDKGRTLKDVEVHHLKEQLESMLPGDEHLEEDLKVLQMFLTLRYSKEPLSGGGGVSQTRYHLVTEQLLSVELKYFTELLQDPIIDVKELRKRLDWIRRLFQLEKPLETATEETKSYRAALLDSIYRIWSLFLQQLSLLMGQQNLSYLLNHYDSEYLSFADEVYHLANHFPTAEQGPLYEVLKSWYDKGAAYYEHLLLESETLSIDEFLDELSEKKWANILGVNSACRRDYSHIQQWARFASRSAFISFLGGASQGLVAYQHIYEQLLEKHRHLKEALWRFRINAESKLRFLPNYLSNMTSLDQHLNLYSDTGKLLKGCFELRKYCEDELPVIDELQKYLTDLTAFMSSSKPLLDWLWHSCYCVANTEGLIGHEMEEWIKQAGKYSASLKYEDLRTVDSLTDYALRTLRQLLHKSVLVRFHPDKNLALEGLGGYGEKLLIDLWNEAKAHIQLWSHSQWGAVAPEGTLQLMAPNITSAEEDSEDEVLPLLCQPEHGLNISLLTLKESYVKRIKEGIPLTKHTRAKDSVHPTCLLYEGAPTEEERETWEMNYASNKIWQTLKLRRKENQRQEAACRKIIDAAHEEINKVREETEAVKSQYNASLRKIEMGLLTQALTAVRKETTSLTAEEEFAAVLNALGSNPLSEILKDENEEWNNEWRLRESFEALLEKENEEGDVFKLPRKVSSSPINKSRGSYALQFFPKVVPVPPGAGGCTPVIIQPK